MSYPDFYDSARVGQLYAPDTNAAVNAGRAAESAPAADDSERVALLLIDAQVDFIHKDGALSVPGAIDDTRRTIEWLFDNLGHITTIIASLDSHLPTQIFSPSWWVNTDGNHPAPYTVITAEEVRAKAWKPLYRADWSNEYVVRLEEYAKKQLMIWPYHTLIGTPGQSITPALYEAIAYHASARQTQPRFIHKGTIPETENYSLFEPEVKLDSLPNGGRNVALLDELAGYKRIYVAGQAKSHCVLESVGSMMKHYDESPETIQKIHVLEDTMSSVAHPDIDFEAIAQEAFGRFSDYGLQMTTTTETSF